MVIPGYRLLPLNLPVRNGFTFGGWLIRGTNTEFSFSSPVNAAVTDLNAHWIGTVTDGKVQFIERLYIIMLGRTADAGGLTFWSDLLTNGMTGQTAAEHFVFSIEYQSRVITNDEYVRNMYRALMGREADAGGLEFWLDLMNKQPAQEQWRYIFNQFSTSPEFRAICASFGVIAS